MRTALERLSEVRLKVVPHLTPKRSGLPEQRAPPPELRSEVHPGLEGGGRGRKPCTSCCLPAWGRGRSLEEGPRHQQGGGVQSRGQTVTTQPLGRERQCPGGGNRGRGQLGRGHHPSPTCPGGSSPLFTELQGRH